jgi:putative transposase
MMLTRRVTFRLYPSATQTARLFEVRRLHAYLYNACVEHRKTSYQRFGKSISYFDQQAALVPFKAFWDDYKALNHGSLQATVRRVDFAFHRFFKGLGGYPRFQAIRRYSGWTYPDARQGFKVHSNGKNGYLELRDLGFQIQMRGEARTWGKPTTCTIVYRNGLWYASITINCEVTRSAGDGAVGIDFGVLSAAALSDGTKIENPRFIAKTQGKVRRACKVKRRKRSPNFKQKVKASKRWRKASKRVSKLQRKVANQRQNWVHQVSTQIVSSNSLVATEKLNLKGMTRKAKQGKRKAQKSGLNRSILDVGMGMLRSALEYKLAEAGGCLVEIPTVTVKPSQTCPNCGHQEKKSLEQRVHHCQQCGYVEDRDVAAAQVMLNWARGKELASSNVDGSSSTECGSMKQLAHMKRQKPPAQPQAAGV